MATALPAKFLPLIVGLRQSVSYRVKEVQYGEGYTERAADGINPRQEEIPVSFPGLSRDDGDELMAFFNARAGVDAVLWIPPDSEVPFTYLVRGVEREYLSGSKVSTINCTFKRIYE